MANIATRAAILCFRCSGAHKYVRFAWDFQRDVHYNILIVSNKINASADLHKTAEW